MIVRVDEVIITPRFPHYLQCAIGDDFIRIHVRGGSRSSLKNIHREMVVMLSIAKLTAGTGDRLSYSAVEQAELQIGGGRCFFYRSERCDERRKFADRDSAN